MDHRVAPDPLVDLVALQHLAGVLGEHVQQLELAAGELEALAADVGLEAVGADLQLARDQRAQVLAGRPRRWRRTTASIRAITSSGWQGFAIQSSAPRRSPRTRWATVAPWVQTITPEVGEHSADPLQELPGQRAEQRGIDEEGVQLHRRQLLGRHRPGENPVLVAGRLEALGEHVNEAGVVVDDGYSECYPWAVIDMAARRGPAGPALPRSSEPHTMVVAPRSSLSRRSQNFHSPLLGIFTSDRADATRLRANEKSSLVRRATHSLPRVARLLFPDQNVDPRTPVAISSSTVIPTSRR